MSNDIITAESFGPMEMDAIGEIENITMGSAATAVSNLLSAKVWITTPEVSVVNTADLTFPELEPSVRVKIEYIKGISGSSVMILKQSDVQLMLNQLMGQPLVVTDDFEFDEMNISAVCEVMNQMMGASATALSELINTPIDISTPEATVKLDESKNYFHDGEQTMVKVSFNLTIDGVINSEFISLMTVDLAKSMAEKMLAGYGSALEEATAAPAEEPAPAPVEESGGGMLSQEEIERMMAAAYEPAPNPIPEPVPVPQPVPVPPPAPAPQPVPVPAPAPQPVPVPQPAPQYAPPQPQYAPPQQQYQQPAVNVRSVQLHSFEDFDAPDLSREQNDNLKLLMGVPLDVTVEIGSTKKKVKEILEFTQGTIIELERQAGAPVDIIVNGHLIAKGDVVVIEDNFAVRITEIVKSRFLDSLGNKE